MPTRVVATLLPDMLAGDTPGARTWREFFGVLLEIESRRDQAIADRLVFGIVGKVHLPVAEVASVAVKSEVGTGNHGEIVRIGGVEQCVKVGEAGSALRQFSEVGILHGALVVGVLEHDNDDAVEVMRRCPGSRPLCFFFLAFRGFRDLWFGLNLRCLVDGSSMENRRAEAPEKHGGAGN